MGLTPNWAALLQQWWGGEYDSYGFAAGASAASNLVFGANPLYQISDFLAVYPKFGSGQQGITGIVLANNGHGSGYSVNDVLTMVEPDAQGGQITVLTVDGAGGILTFQLTSPGTGYDAAGNVSTTGGTGTGAKFNITSISPITLVLPQPVLQLYINLASATLQQARWLDYWQMAMGLFVAHFATLWLRSEGNPGSTAGQIARSGLEAGIVISNSAGDVSKSIKTVNEDLAGFGAWTETTYGTQLATFAKIIGMGGMYIYGL